MYGTSWTCQDGKCIEQIRFKIQAVDINTGIGISDAYVAFHDVNNGNLIASEYTDNTGTTPFIILNKLTYRLTIGAIGYNPFDNPSFLPQTQDKTYSFFLNPLCYSNTDCNDGNQCTNDICSGGSCVYNNQDGTPCNNNAGTCQSGACVPIGPSCGNGQCEAGETSANCPNDCPSCSDTDSGNDYQPEETKTFGTVTFSGGSASDRCDFGVLTEYFCDQWGSNIIPNTINCETLWGEGWVCNNGQCEFTGCVDTDSGPGLDNTEKFYPGVAKKGAVSGSDYCLLDGDLAEFWCTVDGAWKGSSVSCQGAGGTDCSYDEDGLGYCGCINNNNCALGDVCINQRCQPSGGAFCGNTIIEGNEECDDGNLDNGDSCTNGCLNNICGDGFLNAGVEECDDGNTNNNDGCGSTCRIEECNINADCNDNNPCTDDFCNSRQCFFVINNNNACNDGVSCTTDQCSNGLCISNPVDTFCDDGLFCNGIEYCDVGLGCQNRLSPCLGGCIEEGDLCDECGNGEITPGESCDFIDSEPLYPSGFNVCSAFDGFDDTGNLNCFPIGGANECQIDTSACTGGNGAGNCGDGLVNIGESCDGDILNGATCRNLFGQGYTGNLLCHPPSDPRECLYDTSNCRLVGPCEINRAFWSINGISELNPAEIEFGVPSAIHAVVEGTEDCGVSDIISLEVNKKNVFGIYDILGIPVDTVMDSGEKNFDENGKISVFWVPEDTGEYKIYAIKEGSTTKSIELLIKENDGVSDCGDTIIENPEVCDIGDDGIFGTVDDILPGGISDCSEHDDEAYDWTSGTIHCGTNCLVIDTSECECPNC